MEYRRQAGIAGPLFIGFDTHALSVPAWRTALEVLVAGGVEVRTAAGDAVTPTPAVSRAILEFNAEHDAMADGIVVTPATTRRATADSSTTAVGWTRRFNDDVDDRRPRQPDPRRRPA